VWHNTLSASLQFLLGLALSLFMTQGDITLEFTWVDASGTVHTSERHSAEGRGLSGGVGLIGIITEVKLQMTPPSNTKVISKNLLPDASIGQDVLNLVKVGTGWQHWMY
jgi:hypothetical protein